jgi:hypothetical protein
MSRSRSESHARKSLGVTRARQFWRDNARPHATRTLQRVPNAEMNTMQKLNEALPTSDDPAPVLLVEDDDCSMFNKYCTLSTVTLTDDGARDEHEVERAVERRKPDQTASITHYLSASSSCTNNAWNVESSHATDIPSMVDHRPSLFVSIVILARASRRSSVRRQCCS